jgi:SAM-dependent methyltransferase
MRRHRVSERSFEDRLIAMLPSGGRVLDVGAGSGRFAIPLARRGYAVVALQPRPFTAVVILGVCELPWNWRSAYHVRESARCRVTQ